VFAKDSNEILFRIVGGCLRDGVSKGPSMADFHRLESLEVSRGCCLRDVESFSAERLHQLPLGPYQLVLQEASNDEQPLFKCHVQAANRLG